MTRSNRNKTISLTKEEIAKYAARAITPKEKVLSVIDTIFLQDVFSTLPLLPDGFVDLMVVDPPYNLTKKFNKTKFSQTRVDEYTKWMDLWFSQTIRLLKSNASVYICSDWLTSHSVFEVASKYLTARNRITWEREKGRGAKTNWKNSSEDIWFFTVGDKYTFNVDDVKLKKKVIAPYRDSQGEPKDWQTEEEGKYRLTHPSNLWTDITVPFWSMAENTEHPTQKPEKLLAKIILASSNENDVVFDPFIGSGTTPVVAHKLNRRFCGIEIDDYYVALTYKRLELAQGDKSIQGYKDGTFWERNAKQGG